VDAASFERICQEREEQAAVLGLAAPAPHPEASAASPQGYVPCPECARLMNRFNFAHVSGVIVDVCKGHGIWFDAEELRQIVEFIRGGGLVRAREHERLELEQERQRIQRPAPEAARPLFPDSAMTGPGLQPIDYGDVVSAARHLLKSLFG
jgi:Zn-finger nucleic acid-binding protein